MSGFVARIRAFLYKTTFFYANSVYAVARATNPLMEGPCRYQRRLKTYPDMQSPL